MPRKRTRQFGLKSCNGLLLMDVTCNQVIQIELKNTSNTCFISCMSFLQVVYTTFKYCDIKLVSETEA